MRLTSNDLSGRYRAAGTAGRRQLALKLFVPVASVVLLLVFGEVLIRLLASRTPAGPSFLNTLLGPRSWDDVRGHYRDLLKQMSGDTYYLVADELLGWTVGPNRGQNGGLYFSSYEAIRSAALNVRYAVRQPRYRIATVGDSFTFGDEVSFEASWPNRLEEQLGPKSQVLNFGVTGYGIDQAYLRYLRDVRPWHPKLVVLGFIAHDLYRNLRIYHFASRPRWHWPFAKPRLVVDAGTLRLLNVPVPSVENILSARAITDLPFLEYDSGFDPVEWTWRPYHHSYLIRFVLSATHRSRENKEDVSRQAIALGTEIMASFAKFVRDEGSTPFVVYLPRRSDFRERDPRDMNGVLSFLRERRIPFEDLTSCLSKLGASKLFIEGGTHYSPEGNARVATCLAPLLRDYMVARPASGAP